MRLLLRNVAVNHRLYEPVNTRAIASTGKIEHRSSQNMLDRTYFFSKILGFSMTANN